MAITATKKPDDLQPYTVTRAMCMAGERVEVGSTVHLTRAQGTELASAGKVTPVAAEPTKKAKATKPAEPQEPQPAE
jgi:hypothetical protein